MTKPKTTFANGCNNPFGIAQKKPAKPQYIDPDKLVICDDPLPPSRSQPAGKYNAIFAKMKIGQSVKCETMDVNRIANAMRKFVDDRKLKADVRTIRDYGDGKGRVWLVAKEDKLKRVA